MHVSHKRALFSTWHSEQLVIAEEQVLHTLVVGSAY